MVILKINSNNHLRCLTKASFDEAEEASLGLVVDKLAMPSSVAMKKSSRWLTSAYCQACLDEGQGMLRQILQGLR